MKPFLCILTRLSSERSPSCVADWNKQHIDILNGDLSLRHLQVRLCTSPIVPKLLGDQETRTHGGLKCSLPFVGQLHLLKATLGRFTQAQTVTTFEVFYHRNLRCPIMTVDIPNVEQWFEKQVAPRCKSRWRRTKWVFKMCAIFTHTTCSFLDEVYATIFDTTVSFNSRII